MLIGHRWAFIHIPKCGGKTLRFYLNGHEEGGIMPMSSKCAVMSPLHRLPKKRPRGRVFTVIRHPAAWLRSYYLDQSPQRIGVERYLHQYWSDDLDEFVANVCNGHPGYVSDLYQASMRFHTIKVFRLEDGLGRVLDWLKIRHGNIQRINASPDTPQLSDDAKALVAKTEQITLRKYGYI